MSLGVVPVAARGLVAALAGQEDSFTRFLRHKDHPLAERYAEDHQITAALLAEVDEMLLAQCGGTPAK